MVVRKEFYYILWFIYDKMLLLLKEIIMIKIVQINEYKTMQGDAIFNIGDTSPLANPFQEYYDALGDELMHIAYRSSV